MFMMGASCERARIAQIHRRSAPRSPPQGIPARRLRGGADPNGDRTARGATGRRRPTPGIPQRSARPSRGADDRRAPEAAQKAKWNTTRRQVVVGTSAAAAAAVTAVSADRLLIGGQAEAPAASGELTPNDGRWMRVAASSEVPDGVMHPFDLGSVNGFVRRVNGKPEAVSGVCTHQGCRLWFDASDDRLNCPCHTTSFHAQRAGAHPPIADRSKAVAKVDGSRGRRGDRQCSAPASPVEPA